MMPVECVARGYLTGSGLIDYQRTGSVCGIALPAGLGEASKFDEPLFTPATKADLGEHDENITFDDVVDLVGAERADQLRDATLQIYIQAADHALSRGIIIADTKFEFGVDADGELVLADEVLHPGLVALLARRHLPARRVQPSFDKQFVRNWLTGPESGWDRARLTAAATAARRDRRRHPRPLYRSLRTDFRPALRRLDRTDEVSQPNAKRVAERIAASITATSFIDPYEWMRDKDDPEVIAHLEAENALHRERPPRTSSRCGSRSSRRSRRAPRKPICRYPPVAVTGGTTPAVSRASSTACSAGARYVIPTTGAHRFSTSTPTSTVKRCCSMRTSKPTVTTSSRSAQRLSAWTATCWPTPSTWSATSGNVAVQELTHG